MTIAILGCGPAGLLAAHAAKLRNKEFVILSNKKPSPIGGAQFLHEAIPGLTDHRPEAQVLFVYRGSKTGYATKVYGNAKAEVSWGKKAAGMHPMWNLRRIYEEAWKLYEEKIQDVEVTAKMVEYEIMPDYEAVLSCIPAPVLCGKGHQFTYQDVWITQPAPNCTHNTIIYNGDIADGWYRMSSLFGHSNVEWPMEVSQPRVRVRKPLRTTCTCLPGVYRLGRYGAWSKPLLTHDAFVTAMEVLQ